MPKSRPPYPAAFRQQMLELVAAGKTPAQPAREFECTAQTIAHWVAQDATTTDRTRHPGKGYGLVRRQGREDVHTVVELVMANQGAFAVHTLCRVLGVSRSGYYDWLERAPSQRAIGDAVLVQRIRRIHADSDATYGMPRVRAELLEQGVSISRKRIARLMRSHGLRSVSRRRAYVVTTRRDEKQRVAPDLVIRRFAADAPNRLWVADMTYVPTWAGFVFLAIVLDVRSRRVVGWSIGERMDAELVLAARGCPNFCV